MILVLLYSVLALALIHALIWMRVARHWRRVAGRWERIAQKWERLAKGREVDFQATLDELGELERSRPWQRLE